MVQYKCNTCGKEFKLKGDFNRHKNRKFPCSKLNPSQSKLNPSKSDTDEIKSEIESVQESIILKSNTDNQCFYCNKFYSTNSNLHKHIKNNCKVKKTHDKEKENIYNTLIEDMNQLKNKVNDLEKENKKLKGSTINNIQNNQYNSTNLINNDVKLVAFGKEDLDALSEGDLKKIMKKGYKSLTDLFTSINFDKNRPENNNIYSSNIRSKHIIAYNGDKWNLLNKKNTVQDIVNRYGGHIVDKYSKMEEDLDEHTRRKLDRFVDDYDGDEAFIRYDNDITLIMYNKNDLPIERRKLIEQDKFIDDTE